MMSDYEPKSGWNLPAGCFESDPTAPWNQPDPWEGRPCRECTHCRFIKLDNGEQIAVCSYDIDAMEQIDPDDEADECFEN